MRVDPHSNEIRYTFAVVGQTLWSMRPASVRIASMDPDLVVATARSIGCRDYRLAVETPALRSVLRRSLGVDADVADTRVPSDAAVFPFSLEEGMAPTREAMVVAACNNAFSHKGLLGARHVRGSVFGKISELQREYRTRVAAGLFPPTAMTLFGLATLVERADSELFFKVEDAARRRIVSYGRLWRLSSVVVVAGNRWA
jgi:hypothetical protein